MEDQQQTYEKDMESVSSFLLVYDSKKEENRQALRENQKKELALLEKQKLIKDRIQQLDGQLSGDAVSIEEAGKQAETAKEQYAVLESLRDVNTALIETKHLIEEVRQKYGKLAAKKQEEEQTATLLRTKMQEQSEVCEHTVSEKDLLIKDWEDNWKLYAVETDMPSIMNYPSKLEMFKYLNLFSFSDQLECMFTQDSIITTDVYNNFGVANAGFESVSLTGVGYDVEKTDKDYVLTIRLFGTFDGAFAQMTFELREFGYSAHLGIEKFKEILD